MDLRQFEHVEGLQDPLLGQTSQYSVMKNQKFMQTLHNSWVPWAAFSAYNCKNDEVNFYDRSFSGLINDFVKQQICALLEAHEDVLKMNVMPVQQQTNSVDWGTFDELSKTQHFDKKLLWESILQMLPEQHNNRRTTDKTFSKY